MNFTRFMYLFYAVAASLHIGNTVTPNSRTSLVTALTSKTKKIKKQSVDVWILSCITPTKMNENRSSNFQHAALDHQDHL